MATDYLVSLGFNLKTMSAQYSEKAFKSALYALVILALAIILLLVKAISEPYSALLGFLVMLIGILAVNGLVNSLKGRREKNSFRKIFGLVVNFGLLLLFLALIVLNGLDIYNAIR